MSDDHRISRRDALTQLGALLLMGAVPTLRASARRRKPFPHPDPRPGITAEHVIAVDKLPDTKAVRDAYDVARAYPDILDGIYCPCECKDSMGHRSLLACFESRQPTGCMGCQEAAEFVGPLAKQGKSLAEIRQAVDKKFG
jgi:hypothetical protein